MITQILNLMLSGAITLEKFFTGRWVDIAVLIYLGITSLLIIDTIYIYGSKKEVKRDWTYILSIAVYIYFWKNFSYQYMNNPSIYETSGIYALSPICYILHNRIIRLREIFLNQYKGFSKFLETLCQVISSLVLLVTIFAISSSIVFSLAVIILKHILN